MTRNKPTADSHNFSREERFPCIHFSVILYFALDFDSQVFDRFLPLHYSSSDSTRVYPLLKKTCAFEQDAGFYGHDDQLSLSHFTHILLY